MVISTVRDSWVRYALYIILGAENRSVAIFEEERIIYQISILPTECYVIKQINTLLSQLLNYKGASMMHLVKL